MYFKLHGQEKGFSKVSIRRTPILATIRALEGWVAVRRKITLDRLNRFQPMRARLKADIITQEVGVDRKRYEF